MSECRCTRIMTDDAFVCRECARQAHKDLTQAAEFLQWVDEKRARVTSNWNNGTIGRSPDTPLPYDPRVGETLTPIRNTLTTWARTHQAEHPDHDHPPATLSALAQWLSEFTEWAAGKPWAHDAFDQYQAARLSLEKLFDIPADREAIGECSAQIDDDHQCAEILAAEKGATSHKCPKCGTIHDVKERREVMLGYAAELGVTVNESVRLLRTTDRTNVDPRTIRAIIRQVPIYSSGARTELDIKGRRRKVDVYPLGAIRDALDTFDTDRETQKAVRRIVRGGHKHAM